MLATSVKRDVEAAKSKLETTSTNSTSQVQTKLTGH